MLIFLTNQKLVISQQRIRDSLARKYYFWHEYFLSKHLVQEEGWPNALPKYTSFLMNSNCDFNFTSIVNVFDPKYLKLRLSYE